MDDRGELRRLCLHRDAEMDPGEVRWVEESALDGPGYDVRGPKVGGRPAGLRHGPLWPGHGYQEVSRT